MEFNGMERNGSEMKKDFCYTLVVCCPGVLEEKSFLVCSFHFDSVVVFREEERGGIVSE